MAKYVRQSWQVVLLAIILIAMLGLSGLEAAHSATMDTGGCQITSFSQDPVEPYTLGVAVILRGTSNCGTVKFEILNSTGQVVRTLSEIGQPNQTAVWYTSETGSGGFEVCFVARGNTDWNQANRSCRGVYVEGSSAPPPGSEVTGRCWVTNMVATPSAAPIGYSFNFSGQGQCEGNMRASRFTVNGDPYGESSFNTHSVSWDSSYGSVGTFNICFQVTSGDWSDAVQSCTTISVTADGSSSNETVQGPPAGDPPGNSGGGGSGSGSSGGGSSSGGSSSSNAGSGSSGNSNPIGGTIVGCNFLSRLAVGDVAVVADATPDPAPLRSGPSTSNQNLVNVPVRTALTIIGGPSCDGNLVWWETQYDGQTGWIAEINGYNIFNLVPNGHSTSSGTADNRVGGGSSSGGSSGNNSGGSSGARPSGSGETYDSGQGSLLTQMQNNNSGGGGSSTNSICRSNVGLSVGMSAMVTTDPPLSNRLRAGAGTSYSQLAMMEPGSQFNIIGGPRCADGYVWWQVDYAGYNGWTVEGDGGEAWVVGIGGNTTTQTELDTTQRMVLDYLSQIDSEDIPVSESSAQLSDSARYQMLQGFNIFAELGFNSEQLWDLLGIFNDCGLGVGYEGLEFVGYLSVTRNWAMSANLSFSSDSVANCVISLNELFQ